MWIGIFVEFWGRGRGVRGGVWGGVWGGGGGVYGLWINFLCFWMYFMGFYFGSMKVIMFGD